MGGSGWWTVPDTEPADSPYRKKNLEIMKETPRRFARMLGVPVVHASHAGRFVGRTWPGKPDPFSSSYMGETQIISGKGEILARLPQRDGEGVITADVALGEVPGQRPDIPDRFWIPEMPAEEHRLWETQLKSGHEHYLANTLPEMKKRFSRPATKNQD